MLRTLGAALRTAVMAPLFVGYTLVQSARVNRIGRDHADTGRIDRIARDWAKRFLEVPPITLTVEGLENVDPSQRYIVVSNHLSNLDIPVAMHALPIPTRFISKQEVSKFPVFGEAAQVAGVVMVDRDAVRFNHEALNSAIRDSMALGHSILLFAEGTRSRTGKMGKFHRGAARIALAMGIDILPIVITGTDRVNPPGSPIVYPGEVTVRILPPVSIEDMRTQTAPAITENLRERIGAAYEEMTGKAHQS
jgi:1-acyl-sn-glycerol-3-phosphate acyltransferase